MMKTNSKSTIQEPIPTNTEKILDVIVKATSIFPGNISSVLQLFLIPYEKKLANWRSEVTSVINELVSNHNISIYKLTDNEMFISLLYKTTEIAMRNHQKEKLKILKNSLINSVKFSSLKDDECFMFLHIVDNLTVSHFNILSWISKLDNLNIFRNIESLFEVYNKERGIDKSMFRVIIKDLDKMMLIDLANLEDYKEFQNITLAVEINNKDLRVTDFGLKFLNFIEIPSLEETI